MSNTHHAILIRTLMKRLIAILAVLFFVVSSAPSFAATSGEKKPTKSATHKHHDMKEGCCDMKSGDAGKKGDCCKMDSKKDSEKTEKEESKKESDKK